MNVIFFNAINEFSRICLVNLIPQFNRNFNSVNVVIFELFLLRLTYGWPKSDVAGEFLVLLTWQGERVVGLWPAYFYRRCSSREFTKFTVQRFKVHHSLSLQKIVYYPLFTFYIYNLFYPYFLFFSCTFILSFFLL